MEDNWTSHARTNSFDSTEQELSAYGQHSAAKKKLMTLALRMIFILSDSLPSPTRQFAVDRSIFDIQVQEVYFCIES
jgi:hypothetical protein